MKTIVQSPPMQAASLPARRKRPGLKFLQPFEALPFQEKMLHIASGLVDFDKADWLAHFDKAQCYAVYFSGDEVVGFSSVMEAFFQQGDRRVFTIGLGQTVIDPHYRNHFLVQRALIFRWWRAFVRRPFRPICIWGVCLSYKSYLAFVRTLKVVYPCPGVKPPQRHAELMGMIGQHWYGMDYDAKRSAVKYKSAAVTDPLSIPTEQDLLDPAIRFYHDSTSSSAVAPLGLLTISPCAWSNLLPMLGSWVSNVIRKQLGIKRGSRPKK